MNRIDSSPTYFPAQKIPMSKKTKEWYKQCIDGGTFIAIQQSIDRHKKMEVLENLDNDIIDQEEIEKIFNPMELKDATFPAAQKNYPLIIPKIDLLQGEEIKRRFDFVVRSQNLDTHHTQNKELMEMLMDILIEEIRREGATEEEVQERIAEFAKYAKYEWKDMNELVATRIIQYLWKQQDLDLKFAETFRRSLVLGMPIMRVEIVADEPVAEPVNPRNVYTIRGGSSMYIEDSDAIFEITYEPIGKVIDEFYDYLTPSEIDQIENGYRHIGSDGGSPIAYRNRMPDIYSNLDPGGGEGFLNLSDFNRHNDIYGLPYDDEGNVRVIRARWMGRRKVGEVTYYDENGVEQKKLVSEKYVVKEELGETVKWIWINEAYEGTKIANDIYVKCQPREVQMRNFGNKSKCFLGYVGIDMGKSLMERAEPYQYLFNVYMRKFELLMAKYKGPILELDISKVPDDWELDMWMYYAEAIGWAVVDPFNEGKKGAATGKLAGNFNTTGKVLDPRIGDAVQQIVTMLQYIEKIISDLTGVNSQRMGQIENRETVGGVERAVTQSSHITERWFFLHDHFKKRVLLALLDTAKQAWAHSKNKKLNFVLDDMSRVFLEFNGEDIASTEYDLFISNSSKDLEIKQAMRQLSQAAVQNGASLTLIAEVLRSDSVTEMTRIIDRYETDKAERDANQAEAERQAMLEAQQMASEDKAADRELKIYEIDKRAEVELEKARINAEARMGEYDSELEQRRLADAQNAKMKDLSIKEKLANDTIRHNKTMESLKKEELSIKRRQAASKPKS